MAFITHLFKNIRQGILPLLFMFTIMFAQAEDIGVVRAKGELTSNGQMLVSTRFKVDLPSQLKEALTQGVNLNFQLSFELNSPMYPAYKLKLSNWFGSHAYIQYKLSYHPLTDRYRVSIGTLSTDFTTLDAALNSIGSISNWRILPVQTLSGYKTDDVSAVVRLSLSISELPKPFQVNAITSSKWRLDTGLVTLAISKER